MDRNALAERIASRFALPEGAKRVRPYGNGHINDTFLLTIDGRQARWVLQRINGYVFSRPDQVMDNILRVTSYLKDVIAKEGGDAQRETLSVVPAEDGSAFVRDEEGGCWRVFPFVERTVSYDLPDTAALFEETGRGFGRFGRRLGSFPAQTLHETIQGFHDTPARLRKLEAAYRADAAGRAAEVAEEMAFCRAHEEACGALLLAHHRGEIPLRVTHNDTKVNNLLLDAQTGCALCVIDLDTVMPGLAAYDFGDAIRTGASTAAEDERDLAKVTLSLPMMEAFTRGYLSEMGAVMDERERASLPMGAKLMTLENGIRFLTDYLEGDVYFKVHHPGQNLDRARAQFALVRDMESKWREMAEIVRRA